MAVQSRPILRGYFARGKRPTQEQFADLIDSVLNMVEDGISTASGNIGIVTNLPTANLHISRASGNAIFLIEADRDGNNDNDNPVIRLRQDGGATGINIGFNEAEFGPNNFGIGRRYASTDHWETLVIDNSNGNIGIGTTTPEAKLHIQTQSAGGEAIGHATAYASIVVENPTTILDLISDNADNWGTRINLIEGNGPAGNQDIWYILRTASSAPNPGLMIKYGTGPGPIHPEINPSLLTITPGGFIGIGTDTPSAELSVDGAANKTGGGNWGVFSDRRLKEEIEPFQDSLALLKKVKPVWYQYNGKGGIKDIRKNVGVIAQEIQEIFPYMVSGYESKLEESDEKAVELLTFDSSALKFVIINAIKELDERLSRLDKKKTGNK